MKTQATSSSEKKKKITWSQLCISPSSSLGLSHKGYHIFPWGNLEEMEKFAAECFLLFCQGLFFPFLGSMSDCAAVYKPNVVALEKKKSMFVLSYCRDEPGLTPGCRCTLFPWVFVLTVYLWWYHRVCSLMDRKRKVSFAQKGTLLVHFWCRYCLLSVCSLTVKISKYDRTKRLTA